MRVTRHATIPWDLISARVKMDFKEMELNAQVTSSDIFVLRLLSLVFQIVGKTVSLTLFFFYLDECMNGTHHCNVNISVTMQRGAFYI